MIYGVMINGKEKEERIAAIVKQARISRHKNQAALWREYERLKEQLSPLILSSSEYEQAIMKICEALGL